MTSRIPLVDPDHLDENQQRVFDVIAGSRGRVAGPFAVLLHSPELADRVQHLGAFLRYDSALSPRLSELAILVTSRAWSSQFEWYAHEKHAVAAGLPEPVISAIRNGLRPEAMEPDEAVVHDYVMELIETRGVSDGMYGSALEAFGVVGVVDLTAIVGYYTLLAMTLNAHKVEPADGSRPLPDL